MDIGDYVVRKTYNRDILFEITDIRDDVYYLRGVELRLSADSYRDDLELSDIQKHQDIQFDLDDISILKGKVLHLDGDKDYLKLCKDKYDQLNIINYCYYVKEDEMKDKVLSLLKIHKPHILVITGHDALRKNKDPKELMNYKHSYDFIEAVKSARIYESNKDELIIIAGACQSYYEMLLASGANFASSPKRKNIHALDPVFIASQIACESVKDYINIERVINHTSYKDEGIGGIDTKGVARMVYPKKGRSV